MIYVALLRGINVGGNNIVDMKKLKSIFESLGFSYVATYINSGNIIFEELSKDKKEIARDIEVAIRDNFNLDIKVVIRNLDNIEAVCRELPSTWVKNDIMRTDVMFLWEQFDRPDVLELLDINPVDNVRYISGAILWNVEDKDYYKSGIKKLIGTKLYKNMTIRNVNTVRMLYKLMTTVKE
jgi:uncharacterized protein (DUF1697 family)